MTRDEIFDALVELVSRQSVSAAAGKLVYSCKLALSPGNRYIVGFNPGGDPSVETQTVLEHLRSTPTGPWSEYTQARWVLNKKLHEAGNQNRQVRVQRWAAAVGIDLEWAFCTNVIFVRGATVKKTRNDPLFERYTRECATIHGFLINYIQPKEVICFGGDAFRTYSRMEQMDEFSAYTNLSSARGDYVVKRLPHFSLRSSDDAFVEAAVQATISGEDVALPGTRQSDGWPVAIVQDRYGGTYSKGTWIAIAVANRLENGAYRVVRCLEDGPFGDDTDAVLFWSDPPSWIAAGDTPDDALSALYRKNHYLGVDVTHEP